MVERVRESLVTSTDTHASGTSVLQLSGRALANLFLVLHDPLIKIYKQEHWRGREMERHMSTALCFVTVIAVSAAQSDDGCK